MRKSVLAGAIALAGCALPGTEKPIYYEPCACMTTNRPDSISPVTLWWDDAPNGPLIVFRGKKLPLTPTTTAKGAPEESETVTSPREVRLTYPPRDTPSKR